MDTLQIIRARLEAFLVLVNTNGSLGYAVINSFKLPNAYIDRNIYISSVQEANSAQQGFTLGATALYEYQQREAYSITLDLHWGAFQNTETDWTTVETKNYLIAQAIKQSAFLLTGVHPDVGGTDIETGQVFEECFVAGMTELFSGQDSAFPKGHTLTVTIARAMAYSRDDTTMKTIPGTPSAPILDSPADGAALTSATQTFSWAAVTGAVSYTLQVSWDGLFGDDTFYSNESGITGLSYIVSSIDDGFPIYWRVKATNANGDSLWSETRDFEITLPAPVP